MKDMPKEIIKIVDDFLENVTKLLGTHMKNIILYGSYARGDYNKSSDIDIMILTDLDDKNIIKYRDEIWNSAYDIELEKNIVISPIIRNIDKFNYYVEALPFYMNIKREGVVLK